LPINAEIILIVIIHETKLILNYVAF
jgi:hypothetical protein